MNSIGLIVRLLFNRALRVLSYKTDRKIVVFESDDWGNAGVSSRTQYDRLLGLGLPLERSIYDRFDTLANSTDLQMLFDILSKYRDSEGNVPIITANTVVANPDYAKIRQNGFKKYCFEPFNQTLARFSDEHSNAFELWEQGITAGVFFPQFHGREHLNEALWMNELRKGEGTLTRLAFDNRIHGVFTDDVQLRARSREMLYFNSTEQLTLINDALKQGLDMFENIFGYRSKSFIAPRYVWSSSNEHTLSGSGVRYLQGQQFQLIPRHDSETKRKKIRYTSCHNSLGQIYLTRNVFFEPVSDKNATEHCLNLIDKAFAANMPAIVSTHRINFMGHLDPDNRDNGLRELNTLLWSIVKRWPDVEFMTSVALGELIEKEAER